ncbi:MAG: phospholipid carrier-dependent glycosyltransferase [Anaerolineae bacterium]|nr:phospholipid carrier-dependent glycosyltransferase [Anaerolineae bacterium]
MTVVKQIAQTKKPFLFAEAAISLGLFLLALLPRAYALQHFVTADEAKWVYRSAQFLSAFLRGDFAATTVNLTPAVTTTWLGSLGLAAYHSLHWADIGLSLPEWLLTLPEFRPELDVLAATRWPMVILTSLSVAAVYLLTRSLFNRALAFVAAAFIALSPHFVALSRILGHDAPAAVFMTLSLLLLLWANNLDEFVPAQAVRREQKSNRRKTMRRFAPHLLLVLSGLMAGLAFLSKAPALFLIPFAILVFAGRVWRQSASLYFWFKRFLLWLFAAYLAFLIFWPAAWVDPLGRPLAVIENAFFSATDQEEADAEGYWQAPDLGPFYYLAHGSFKLSPLVLVGAGLAAWYLSRSIRQTPNLPNDHAKNKKESLVSPKNYPMTLLWLLGFVLLFTLFITLSDKRSPRYILPAFPPLALLAAYGWLTLLAQVSGVRNQELGDKSETPEATTTQYVIRHTQHLFPLSSLLFPFLLTLSALIILLPYAPYYFTYFNPLLGGPYTAPRLVKIGWGEGLDQVGRFLQAQWPNSRVGAPYASTVAPFFAGDLSDVMGDHLDYVVLYRKQVQSGEPSPAFIRYYEYSGSIFSVDLNGIRYADVYPGPALQWALTLTPGLDHGILPLPLGFRPLTPYGRLGELLAVDVVWLAKGPLPNTPSIVTLQPLSVFDFLNEHNDEHGTSLEPRAGFVLAEGPGSLTRLADDLIVSRHLLPLPADLPRGRYALLVDGRPLGEVEARNFQLPPELNPVNQVIFDQQIGLAAYQLSLADDTLGLNIAWRAETAHLPDYTVFVQLLNAETNERLAGVDTQPLAGDWPTGAWVKEEVVFDKYVVSVPPDLPPGFYKLIVGFYQPATGRRLTLPGGQDYWTVPWTLVREKQNQNDQP